MTFWAHGIAGGSMGENMINVEETSEILQSAEGTLCYIGPEITHSQRALERLKALGGIWGDCFKELQIPEHPTHEHRQSLKKLLQSKAAAELDLSDDELWQAVREIIAAPYFRTPHIFTEIMLAQTLYFLVGSTWFMMASWMPP